MKFKFALHLVATSLFISSASAATTVFFDFREDGPDDQAEAFDGGGIGASVVGVDPSDVLVELPLTLTTVDIIGSNGVAASSGDPESNHVTNISGQDAISINTDNASGATGGADSSHFNNGEGWIFSFDQDVNLTNVEVESFSAGQIFTVSSGGTTVNLVDTNNPLMGFFVPADTSITIIFDGFELDVDGAPVTGDNQVRVESLTAEIVPVPEPTSSLLVALGGLALFARRRR